MTPNCDGSPQTGCDECGQHSSHPHCGEHFDFCRDWNGCIDPYAMFVRPKFEARDQDGSPLIGGKVFVYQGGSSIPKPTYTNPSMSRKNTWPVILDSSGRADIWWTGPAKIVCSDKHGVRLWTVDNYIGFSGFVCKRPQGSTSGLVLASDTDASMGTLYDKLSEGPGIALSVETNDAGAQTVEISAQPVLDELHAYEDEANSRLDDLESALGSAQSAAQSAQDAADSAAAAEQCKTDACQCRDEACQCKADACQCAQEAAASDADAKQQAQNAANSESTHHAA